MVFRINSATTAGAYLRGAPGSEDPPLQVRHACLPYAGLPGCIYFSKTISPSVTLLAHYWLFESGRRFKAGLPGVSDSCSAGFVDDPDCCVEFCCGGAPVWSPFCESSRRLRTGRFGVSE